MGTIIEDAVAEHERLIAEHHAEVEAGESPVYLDANIYAIDEDPDVDTLHVALVEYIPNGPGSGDRIWAGTVPATDEWREAIKGTLNTDHWFSCEDLLEPRALTIGMELVLGETLSPVIGDLREAAKAFAKDRTIHPSASN